MTIPKIRVCKDCEKVKDIEHFPTNRHKTLSYRHRCKDCEKVAKKAQNKKFYQLQKMKLSKIL